MSQSSLLKTTLKLVVAGGLIYWLIAKGLLDLSVFSKVSSIEYLAPMLAIALSNILMATWRWHSLLNSVDVSLKFFEVFKLNMIGIFFNFAMPGGVGGDVVKGYYIIKEQPNARTQAATSIIADRFLGLFTMVLMAMGSALINLPLILTNFQLRLLFMGVLAVFCGFLCFAAFLYSRRIRSHRTVQWALEKLPAGRIFAKSYDSMQQYLRNPYLTLKCIALSFFAHSSAVVFFMIIASAMGVEGVPVSAYFFVIPLGLIAMALPISPAGIGVGQAAFLFLFNVYLQRDLTLGADALTMWQVSMLCLSVLGVVFYLQRKEQLDEAVVGGQ